MIARENTLSDRCETNLADPRDPTQEIYNSPEVAKYYGSLNYLSACEKLLFDTFLKPGDAIIDVGVGGGRTTPYLSSLAGTYIGVDYAHEMVTLCRSRFPHLEFLEADAQNLAPLDDQSFDALVMSFNGLDCVASDQSRLRCLAEFNRLLKDSGILIFSSHNPRAVLLRPAWNSKGVEELVRRRVGAKSSFLRPATLALILAHASLSVCKVAVHSLFRLLQRGLHQAFWRGEGYMLDSAHGGLLTHYAVPSRVVAEVEPLGFQFLKVVGDDYPRRSKSYTTEWYYYVFRKAGRTASVSCA